MKRTKTAFAGLFTSRIRTLASTKTSMQKSFAFLISLSLSAVLVGCSSSSNSTPTSGDSVAATTGSGQSAQVSMQFASPLQASVTMNGSPVAGVTVTFTAPTTGASLSFAGVTTNTNTITATTNGGGVATSYGFTANATAGVYSVTASVPGGSSAASYSLTNTGIPGVAATAGTTQSATVGSAFATQMQATVSLGGTAVSGVAVTFSAPFSGASGTFANNSSSETDTTNASGVATSSVFTASRVAGLYSVNASIPGSSAAATFSLTNNAGAPVALTATSGTPQSAQINRIFAALSATVVDSYSNPVAGVPVTFTAPTSGASGTFANHSATETDTTNVSGVATTATFTANATVGSYIVTGSVSGVPTPANFNLNNTSSSSPTLTPGQYVFSLNGGFFDDIPYCVAGVVAVGTNGTITGGEQDSASAHQSISSTGSSYVISGDGNVIFTLSTQDTSTGTTGVEILDASLVSSSRALLTEFDSTAVASGSMDLQTASPATPSGPYAFYIFGQDSRRIAALGGVINVDSPGGISGVGSAFDINDANLTGNSGVYTDQLFALSTVTSPDSFGRVLFTLNPAVGDASGIAPISLSGYVVDSKHIRLVEVAGGFAGVTGGAALGQTGSFTNSSLSGSSDVFGTSGVDNNGPVEVAGVLTLTATSGSSTAGTVSGTLNFSDPLAQNGQGGSAFTGTYNLDLTDPGRITLSNLTDSGGAFDYSMQLYLTGDGHALLISADAEDCFAGLGFAQTGPFTAASFNGNYVFNFAQGTTLNHYQQSGVGAVAADGAGSFAGYADMNGASASPGITLSGTFSSNADGVFMGTITGLDTANISNIDNFTYYLVDSTKAFAIETDSKPNQVTLGYFELQQ